MKRIVVFLLVLCTLLTQVDVSMFAMERKSIEKVGDETEIPATSITLNEEKVTIYLDDSVQLIATVLPDDPVDPEVPEDPEKRHRGPFSGLCQ